MIALLVGALSACGLWETRITSLSIDNSSDITMIVGETLELSVTVKPKSRTEKIQFKAETVDKNRNLLNDGSEVVTIDEKDPFTGKETIRVKIGENYQYSGTFKGELKVD